MKETPNAIEQFCSLTESKITEHVAQPIAEYYKLLVLQFLSLIAEESAKLSDSSTDGQTLRIKLSGVSETVLSIAVQLAKDGGSSAITSQALMAISNWVSYNLIKLEFLIPLIDVVLVYLHNLELIETVSEVLISLLSDNRLASGLEMSIPSKILPIICSAKFESLLKEAIFGIAMLLFDI